MILFGTYGEIIVKPVPPTVPDEGTYVPMFLSDPEDTEDEDWEVIWDGAPSPKHNKLSSNVESVIKDRNLFVLPNSTILEKYKKYGR